MAEQQFHGCDEMAPRCSKVNSFREAPGLHLPEAAELEFLHRAAWRSVVVPPLIDQGKTGSDDIGCIVSGHWQSAAFLRSIRSEGADDRDAAWFERGLLFMAIESS